MGRSTNVPSETILFHPQEWVLWSVLCLLSLTVVYVAVKGGQYVNQTAVHRPDLPIASVLLPLYMVLGAIAFMVLVSDLCQGVEAPQERRQRHFRQTLKDPLLRAGIEKDARTNFQGDEQKVSEFMARLDARARVAEETNADDDWKSHTAKWNAWKDRVKYLWTLRKVLVGLICLSLVLMWVGRSEVDVAMDGGLVLTLVFAGTYFCLPKCPKRQLKNINSDLATPLTASARIV